MEASKFVWMDGAIVPWADARVHVMSYGLHYGVGVFEGLRCHDSPRGPAIFRLDDHIQRLARSAKLYLMQLPFPPAELMEACRETVRSNGMDKCYIRMIVHSGVGGSTPLDSPFHTAIACAPDETTHGVEAAETGIRAKVSSFGRLGPSVIPPAAKATGQYLNSFLAKVDAVLAGYDECIMLNDSGLVTEGSAQNIFVVADRVLLTPPGSAGALPGITRHTVMSLAERLDYDVRVENLVRSDLYAADEAFFTGTRAGIVPITDVDSRPVGDGSPGSVTKVLQAAYTDLVHGHVEDLLHWLAPVTP